MLLKDCYDMFGGSYENVKQRIPKEEMIERFVIKFLSDSSYEVLCRSFEEGDYAEAFRAAHSLKGVSQNLGFLRLVASASALTEYLRNSSEKQSDKAQCQKLLKQVSEDYFTVVEAVRMMKDA